MLICKRPERRSAEQERTFSAFIARDAGFTGRICSPSPFEMYFPNPGRQLPLPLDSRCVRIGKPERAGNRLSEQREPAAYLRVIASQNFRLHTPTVRDYSPRA